MLDCLPGPDGLADLSVEELLLVLVSGEVVQQEGGGGAGRVDARHHHVDGHDDRYGRVFPALPEELGDDGLTVFLHALHGLVDVPRADVELFLSQPEIGD